MGKRWRWSLVLERRIDMYRWLLETTWGEVVVATSKTEKNARAYKSRVMKRIKKYAGEHISLTLVQTTRAGLIGIDLELERIEF